MCRVTVRQLETRGIQNCRSLSWLPSTVDGADETEEQAVYLNLLLVPLEPPFVMRRSQDGFLPAAAPATRRSQGACTPGAAAGS